MAHRVGPERRCHERRSRSVRSPLSGHGRPGLVLAPRRARRRTEPGAAHCFPRFRPRSRFGLGQPARVRGRRTGWAAPTGPATAAWLSAQPGYGPPPGYPPAGYPAQPVGPSGPHVGYPPGAGPGYPPQFAGGGPGGGFPPPGGPGWAGQPPPVPARKRSKLPWIIGLVVVLALVAGADAVLVIRNRSEVAGSSSTGSV